MATIWRIVSRNHGDTWTKYFVESHVSIDEVDDRVKKLNDSRIWDETWNYYESYGYFSEDLTKNQFMKKERVRLIREESRLSEMDKIKREKPWHFPDNDDPIERYSRYD